MDQRLHAPTDDELSVEVVPIDVPAPHSSANLEREVAKVDVDIE
jgi:hypothetical protein